MIRLVGYSGLKISRLSLVRSNESEKGTQSGIVDFIYLSKPYSFGSAHSKTLIWDDEPPVHVDRMCSFLSS